MSEEIMSDSNYTAKVLNHSQISPPAGSVPRTPLPLTFFDAVFIACPPTHRFLFYQFPHSTHHFMEAIFPNLERSLSLSLQHFFPLAGNFIFPPKPHNPHILFNAHDSVPLTVAESTHCDFDHLIADYPRDAKYFYPFVPDVPEARVLHDGTHVVPLLALQITVFPNQGLCICVAFHHVVADGMAIFHFMKSWASIYRNGAADSGSFDGPLPYLDRALVKDPNGIESVFVQDLSGWDSSWIPVFDKPIAPVGKVRATFVLTKTQIENLKIWVSARESEPLRLSAFVVTCSLVWSCLIQTIESKSNCFPDKDEECYFLFTADCRNRFEDPIIPSTYFGNCLDLCFVKSKMKDLLERGNIGAVAKAIGNRVKEFEREKLKMADKWLSELMQCEESGRFINIAGSPKLRAYDTDFGWGRPLKVEMLHIDKSKTISLHESRDEKGGIEIGLGLSKSHMDRFTTVWEENLKVLCS